MSDAHRKRLAFEKARKAMHAQQAAPPPAPTVTPTPVPSPAQPTGVVTPPAVAAAADVPLPRFIKLRDAAARLGKSVRTLRRMEQREDGFPKFVLVGGETMLVEHELHAYMSHRMGHRATFRNPRPLLKAI